jgi:hypothetical protein
MKRRSLRHILLATAAAASGLVIATTFGDPAGAAVVSQGLNCGIGGNQTSTLSTTAPATVETGGTFQVTLAPSGPAGKADGAEIKNMVTTFNVPSGASIVPGSASATGGSGTLGAVSTAISGTTVRLTVPGPIANGASFVNPTLKFNLTATGAAGATIRTTFRQSAAYTLTAAGSFNVSCDTSAAPVTLTSTSIQAAATTTTTAAPTTTTTTGATTTTTGGGTTSTTAATTTTAPVPTTTAPPIITTQNWSPGTACGTQQSTTAPANTTSVSITAIGGNGGQSGSQASSAKRAGGTGGQAFGTFAASPGQIFSAVVGCNGANGQNGAATSTSAAGWSYGGNTGTGSIVIGQTGAGGGGGGASSGACLGPDCGAGLGTPLVVAGGGGGGGVSNCAGTPSGSGGAAGNGASSNGDGGFGPRGSNGGNGGNSGSTSGSILGGAGGVNTDSPIADGANAPSTGPLDGLGVSVVGGGGGGGYAGGKQGQNANTGCKGAGGGGGGSSWVKGTATNAVFSAGSSPSVVLTFTISTPAPTTTTTTQATTTTTQATTTTTQATTTTTATPCTADKVPFPTVQALVNQQYLDFTGATPTSAQNNQWVPAITNCSATADALIVSLLPTDQTLDDARLVRLYVAYFNRPPDPDGFAYWQRQLDNGKGLINAAKKFAESSEFKRTYGTLSNSAFIDLVYQNVLGRAPDPSGKAFWLTRLDNKTKNRGDVMINFSESSENVNKKVNHVQVFRMYRGMMQKFPSRTGYFDLLNPILNSGKTLEDAAKAIRLSPAYDARV